MHTTTNPLHIAIIGSGPRGLSVLERLSARLLEEESQRNVDIYLIDDGHVGAGRIWRPEQSPLLRMNTIAQEISAFSGLWDGTTARPGNGPSFAQWLQMHCCDAADFGGYAPRGYYGEYLCYVLAAVESALPANVRLHKVTDCVSDLEELTQKSALVQRLHLQSGDTLTVDSTVLATGHARNKLQGLEKKLADFAALNPAVAYLAGDSAADMALAAIPAGQSAGIIGMGLAFFDILAELTLGRGGQFSNDADGSLKYIPSGSEPRIYAGCRGGMPIPPRGHNQKPLDYEYTPAIYTLERAHIIRERGDVHFNRDVLPLLEAELTLVHAETRLRQQQGRDAAQSLRRHVLDSGAASSVEVIHLASDMGLNEPVPIDLYRLAAPLQGRKFSSAEAFAVTLIAMLEHDYAEAMLGNLDSPIKAALDVIRNTRSVTRAFVDFGGLDPNSHQLEFLNKFSPISGFLSAGPPAFRTRQLLALIKAEIVTVVGPDLQIEPSAEQGCFFLSSPHVQGAQYAVRTVIDARIPATDIRRDSSKLTGSLLARGIFTPFINRAGEHVFETGGVNVTKSPFHPLRSDNSVASQLYVLGIPTEHARWFMQSGSSRPHKWIDFMIDADAIAADILIKNTHIALPQTKGSAPRSSIMQLLERFRDDPRPNKMNLTVGIYSDESGLTPILETVHEAEYSRFINQTNKASFNLAGSDEFHRAVYALLFPSLPVGEIPPFIQVIQTLGASGALSLAAQLIQQHKPGSRIWLSSPTWENHPALLGGEQANFGYYRYQATNFDRLCLDSMMEDLMAAKAGDVVLLHVCCHNPTGIDPDLEQWEILARFCASRKLIPLFDFAYQGFSHSIQRDALPLALFMEKLDFMLVCNSFSKNMGIYDERTGALTLINRDIPQLKKWGNEAKLLIRSSYSMPPLHGSFIASYIINQPEVFERWQVEVSGMRDDLFRRRTAFLNALADSGILGQVLDYRCQQGMFLCLNLPVESIEYLRSEYGIYLLDSGRMCIASLAVSDIPHFCTALKGLVQQQELLPA